MIGRYLELGAEPVNDPVVVQQKVYQSLTGIGKDTTHTRGDAFFFCDFESADYAGISNVCTATEFLAECVDEGFFVFRADGDYTDFVAVFFAE